MTFQLARILLIFGSLVIASPFAYCQDATRTVTVTGRGATFLDAHEDAVRQALQQAVKQLVFADRSTVNDRLILDRVLSTMNGYIDAVRPIRKFRDTDGTFVIEEEITVSTTRIVNFLGIPSGTSVAVPGGLLSADSAREILQRKARGEIFDRLLSGLPSSAVELTFDAPVLDQSDPTQFIVGVSAKLSKPWIDRLKTALQAIAVGRIRTESVEASRGKRGLAGMGLLATFQAFPVADHAVKFCIFDETELDCFCLPPGEYGKALLTSREAVYSQYGTPPTRLAIRLADETGNSVLRGGVPCLKRDIEITRPSTYTTSLLFGFHKYQIPIYYVFANKVLGSFTIKATEVDMHLAARLVGVPFFAARRYGDYISLHSGNIRNLDDAGVLTITDISSDKAENVDVCRDLLDDAMFKAMTPSR